MRLRQIRQRIEARRKPAKLTGLNKSQMPLRQLDGLIAGNRSENPHAGFIEARACQAFVPRAAHAIQDNARDFDTRPEAREAARNRRRCLGLAGNVEHQDNGQAGECCDIGTRSIPPLPGGSDAVEQPHERFDNNEVRALGLAQERERGFLPHRPAVEVVAWTPASRLVKGRIDIVRAAFERLYAEAAALERPQKPERDHGFARAGARGGNKNAMRLAAKRKHCST